MCPQEMLSISRGGGRGSSDRPPQIAIVCSVRLSGLCAATVPKLRRACLKRRCSESQLENPCLLLTEIIRHASKSVHLCPSHTVGGAFITSQSTRRLAIRNSQKPSFTVVTASGVVLSLLCPRSRCHQVRRVPLHYYIKYDALTLFLYCTSLIFGFPYLPDALQPCRLSAFASPRSMYKCP